MSDNPYGQQPPGGWGQGGPPTESGYAFGPFAPQPGPGAPGPGVPGPYPVGPPPGGPPPTPGRGRARGLVILGVVALMVVLVGVGTAVVLSRSAAGPDPTPTGGRTGGGGTSPPTSAPPAASLASDAVSGYLTAVAAGDAASALAYAAKAVPAGPFLTDAVLAESRRRAPITDITVPAVDDPLATTVAARYKLGGTEVRADYAVEQVGGVWKLSTVFRTLDLNLVRTPAIPVRINGVKVNSYYVDVLPGSYAFTTESPLLTFGDKAVVTVRDPNDYANVLDLKLGLSRAGQQTVVRLAKQRYGQCLKARVTRPRNCPFYWVNNNPAGRFREGSVRWRQDGRDPWAKPRVAMIERAARIVIPIKVQLSGPCSIRGRTGTCSGNVTGTAVASVRMDKPRLQAVWIG